MSRICKACGDPLSAHDVERRKRMFRDGNRISIRVGNVYGCKVRLIATSPGTGKTFVPNSPQRIARVDTRWVKERRFLPGGDLHA